MRIVMSANADIHQIQLAERQLGLGKQVSTPKIRILLAYKGSWLHGLGITRPYCDM
jgi:hypothetical protein